MRVSGNNPADSSNQPQATNTNKKTAAPLSKTVQRSEAKLRNELAQEKAQFTETNLKEMSKIIHMQQSRNPHQPVSNKQFTDLTGAPPANMPNFNQTVRGN